jgi:hypothetical protein
MFFPYFIINPLWNSPDARTPVLRQYIQSDSYEGDLIVEPHIVKGEGLETSQFVFYSPVLGNLNTISLNLKIKSAVSISDHFDWLETGWHRE